MRCTDRKIWYYLIVIKKDKKQKNNFLYQGGYIMKLSSKVLAGSLASAGMVLSLVAPALTAQAATTTGQFDKDGTYKQVPASDVGSLTKDGHDLAIAYDSMPSDATTATYGTATATSNANVNVISGILVLDAVPNFGFGSGASGSTVALNPNQTTSGTGVDGNDEGTLQVTDARADKTTSATKGFALNATLGAFTDSTGKALTAGGSDFTLNLTPQSIVDGTGKNVTTGATDVTTNATALKSDDSAATASVMSPKAGSYNVGTLKAAFDSAKAASLVIPKGVDGADNSTPSTKAMQSMITWTLNADPSAVLPAK